MDHPLASFNPLIAGPDDIQGFQFFIRTLNTSFKDKTWHQSTRLQNRWLPFWQIWIIFTHLKLWIASARHNFKWCWYTSVNTHIRCRRKWNESGSRPPLCTYKLNWARRTSWGWWDDWDDTALQTQDSKFEPWRSEAEHATSRSRRLPTILTFTRGWGRNIFVPFKPPRPGTEPRTLAWKAAVLTPTPGPPPSLSSEMCSFMVLPSSCYTPPPQKRHQTTTRRPQFNTDGGQAIADRAGRRSSTRRAFVWYLVELDWPKYCRVNNRSRGTIDVGEKTIICRPQVPWNAAFTRATVQRITAHHFDDLAYGSN